MAYPEEAMVIRHCLKPCVDFNDISILPNSGFLSAIINNLLIVGQHGGDKLYMLCKDRLSLNEMRLSLTNFRLGALYADNHGKLYIGCSNSHCIYEGFV